MDQRYRIAERTAAFRHNPRHAAKTTQDISPWCGSGCWSLKGLAVHSRRSLIGKRQPVGMAKPVRVTLFPAHAAFPVIQAGQRSPFPFRGLLRVLSHNCLTDGSIAPVDLGHQASICSFTRELYSSAFKLAVTYLGGTSPLASRAFVVHLINRTNIIVY